MNNKLKKEIIENLENEIKELNFKIKKARESENWGTYKNIIQAYTSVLDLTDKYKSEITDKNKIVNKIIDVYYNTIDDDNLLKEIQEYLGIEYDINNIPLNPSHVWEFSNLLSEIILKILEKNIQNYYYINNNMTYKHFNSGEEIVFKIVNKNSKFEVCDSPNNVRVQNIYNNIFTSTSKDTKIETMMELIELLNNKSDIIEFLRNVVNGYIDYIKNSEIILNKKDSENIYIGIEGNPTLYYKQDKMLTIKIKISINVV